MKSAEVQWPPILSQLFHPPLLPPSSPPPPPFPSSLFLPKLSRPRTVGVSAIVVRQPLPVKDFSAFAEVLVEKPRVKECELTKPEPWTSFLTQPSASPAYNTLGTRRSLPLCTSLPVVASVQFKMVSMRSEKPVCAPPLLSEVSPTLPLKQFRCLSD